MLDMVVPRSKIRATIAVLLRYLMPRRQGELQLTGPSDSDADLTADA